MPRQIVQWKYFNNVKFIHIYINRKVKLQAPHSSQSLCKSTSHQRKKKRRKKSNRTTKKKSCNKIIELQIWYDRLKKICWMNRQISWKSKTTQQNKWWQNRKNILNGLWYPVTKNKSIGMAHLCSITSLVLVTTVFQHRIIFQLKRLCKIWLEYDWLKEQHWLFSMF